MTQAINAMRRKPFAAILVGVLLLAGVLGFVSVFMQPDVRAGCNGPDGTSINLTANFSSNDDGGKTCLGNTVTFTANVTSDTIGEGYSWSVTPPAGTDAPEPVVTTDGTKTCSAEITFTEKGTYTVNVVVTATPYTDPETGITDDPITCQLENDFTLEVQDHVVTVTPPDVDPDGGCIDTGTYPVPTNATASCSVCGVLTGGFTVEVDKDQLCHDHAGTHSSSVKYTVYHRPLYCSDRVFVGSASKLFTYTISEVKSIEVEELCIGFSTTATAKMNPNGTTSGGTVSWSTVKAPATGATLVYGTTATDADGNPTVEIGTNTTTVAGSYKIRATCGTSYAEAWVTVVGDLTIVPEYLEFCDTVELEAKKCDAAGNMTAVSVNWSITSTDATLSASLSSDSGTSATLTRDSGYGEVTVKAVDPANPTLEYTATLTAIQFSNLRVSTGITPVVVSRGDKVDLKVDVGPSSYADRVEFSLHIKCPENQNPASRIVGTEFHADYNSEISNGEEVTVYAHIPGVDSCVLDLPITIEGCSSCGPTACSVSFSDSEVTACGISAAYGTGNRRTFPPGFLKIHPLGSITASISLGKSSLGERAGWLTYHEDEMSQSLVNPASVVYTKPYAPGVAVIGSYDAVENSFRQIMAPQALVDNVQVDDHRFDLRFYTPSQAGNPGVDGIYAPTGTPYGQITFINPDGASANNRVKIQKYVDSILEEEYLFAYSDTTGTWSMEANGIRKDSLASAVDGDGIRWETRTIAEPDGTLVSKSKTGYMLYSVSANPTDGTFELPVRRINDPDGAALTTVYDYFNDTSSGRHAKLRSVSYPDGSWAVYRRDTQGRVTCQLRPIGDLAMNEAGIETSRATINEYGGLDPRPVTVTEKVAGVVTGVTYYRYDDDDSDETETDITERAASQNAAYGASGNQRSTTVTYTYDDAVPDHKQGKVWKSLSPEGMLTLYDYEEGTLDTSNSDPANWTFTPQAGGSSVRTTVTTAPGDLANGHTPVAYRTTRSRSVADSMKNVLLDETEVNTGSGTWERIDWTAYEYDDFGRLTDTFRANGTEISTEWGSCCGKEGETLADGTEMSYTYDELRRLDISTKIGEGAQPDLVTDATYDAAGRRTGSTRTGGTLSLSSFTEYDIAGRVRVSTSQNGTISKTDFSSDGLTTTSTMPGGATRITTRYPDGRTKSVTGTGVTPTFYEYGVNTDGTRWTIVYTGTGDNTAAMWQKTTTDFLGRTVKTEKPTFDGGTAVSESFYNSTCGHLVRSTSPGRADTLYEYDSLCEMVRSGLDVSDDGQLTLASMDRISDSATVFEKDASGHWWRKSTSKTYPSNNNATAVTTSTSRQRLTGLGIAAPTAYSGILTAESASTDIHGNTTVTYTYTDRPNKTVWRVTDVPASTVNAVTKTVNGLVVSVTAPTIVDASDDAAATTYGYDGLGRRTTVVDPRTGTSTTHYNSLGQVDWVEDADSNRTTYGYDNAPAGTSEENLINYTGRRISTTNALNKTQYTNYTLRGQTAATWGDTTYPLAYDYDASGRMEALYTLRHETVNISSYADIIANLVSFDKTVWIYEDSTGLLERKEYPDTKGTDYTYDDANRLDTRTWARTSSGDPLVTEYTYDSKTGELTKVDYSDTPGPDADIEYTYYRTGQKNTVRDDTGTRTFTYSATTLQLDTETLNSTFYGDVVLTRRYDAKGRNAGYKLGTSTDDDATQAVAYGYDTYGRFHEVTSSDFPTLTSVDYSYLADSAMINTASFPNGLTTTRAYEGNRNLVDYVENDVAGTDISKYDYTNDDIGRRTDTVMTGSEFTTGVFNSYDYNDRSEVIAGNRYDGTDITDKTSPVTTYDYGYDYDPIGNRDTYDVAGTTTTYTANQLNQYTAITNLTPPDYDEDGNMTLMPSAAGDWEITWNGENRMKVAQSSAAKLEFIYDYMGRRVQKKVYSGSGATGWTLDTSTKYVYDGWNLIAELDATDSNALLKTYTWGLDLSQTTQGAGGVGGLLAVTEQDGTTPATYYATYDANGNVSEYLDSTGAVVAHYEYSPFGRTTGASGTKPADFAHRFSTKYLDEHGLYYYGRRSYSPELGRWINRDPAGECRDQNLYGLGMNRPTTGGDAFGLAWDDDFRRAGKTCCPACEWPALLRKLDRQKAILRVWKERMDWPRDVIPGLVALGGMRGCPASGEPTIVFNEDNLDLGSCFGKCVAIHEGHHRDQCMNHRDDFSWSLYGLSKDATADIEIPAYEKSISCIEGFIRFAASLTKRYGSREKACLCCLRQHQENGLKAPPERIYFPPG